MAFLSLLRASVAALALAMTGCGPGETTAPATYAVELDAEKDYFAPDTVRILATPRGAAEVELGTLDVTIRRRIEVTVPAGVRELVFRTTKNIEAKLPLLTGQDTNKGKILVRPLANASSASGIAWMLGKRGGVALKQLVVEWEGKW